MRNLNLLLLVILTAGGFAMSASGQGVTKPTPLLDKVVTGMPRGAEQEVRVMTANFKPGDQTVFHTHRFPVTVFILEGEFTLDLADRRDPVVVKAGEAFVEPVGVRMTGYNRSTTAPLRVVIFYVSEKGTPFLDPIDRGTHDSHAKP